jgi:hypothetical protein
MVQHGVPSDRAVVEEAEEEVMVVKAPMEEHLRFEPQ